MARIIDNEPIFQMNDGKKFNKYSIGRMIKNLCAMTGIDIDRISSHGLRKGWTQWALENGLPAVNAMKQTDWRSEQSLRRYNETAPRKAQVKVFSRIFQRQTCKSGK